MPQPKPKQRTGPKPKRLKIQGDPAEALKRLLRPKKDQEPPHKQGSAD